MRRLIEWWDGYLVVLLLAVAILMAMIGCNQQIEPRPWPHEPTPDHWLESYWLSPEEAEAKLKWERENPPETFAEGLLR